MTPRNYTHRQLMELVVELARACPEEPDRVVPTPKVAALLYAKGMVEPVTCQRGQTGPGDHAEFGLIDGFRHKWEKWSGERDLTLYVSLEPCTFRGKDKTPCETHIERANLKHVVIGTLDPNPKIRGDGIRKLLAAGIEVRLFDLDLTATLEEINRPFSTYIAAAHGQTVLGREELLAEGRRRILSAKKTITLFGGDISWADKYRDALLQQISNGVTARAYFDSTKGEGNQNAELLSAVGVETVALSGDIGMRAMLIDEADNDKRTLFLARKQPRVLTKIDEDLDTDNTAYRGKIYDMHTDELLLLEFGESYRALVAKYAPQGYFGEEDERD
jgi:pyrimidine deaminase RibD-like protein